MMKLNDKKTIFFIICLLALGVWLLSGNQPAIASMHSDELTETPTPTATQTATPTATETAEPEESPTTTTIPFSRPLVVFEWYDAGGTITPGTDFTLTLRLNNAGGAVASNVVASFISTEFLPLSTGGVRAISELAAGSSATISQPMRASMGLWGYSSGAIQVDISYTDPMGNSYSETFNITINLQTPVYSVYTPTPTPTPLAEQSAQLVVENYTADVDPLQPGTIFNLTFFIHNQGLDDAKKVTMVLGGGVEQVQPGEDGKTPGSGLAGGSADLKDFAPLGTSNLIFLDQIAAGAQVSPTVQLIVNVNTTPGAYPFRVSFVYENAQGERVVDDQVITLLVYNLPKIEFSFYRDPGLFYAGQPTILPIQINNLGRTTAMLSNMTVTAAGVEITENSLFVGMLEPGGFFTMDATAWLMNEGALDLVVSISYTDDFNQVRIVEQVISINVEAMDEVEYYPSDDLDGDGIPDWQQPQEQPETFWQKVWRFIKGLLGLGSGKDQPGDPYQDEPYIEEEPVYPPGGKG